MEYKDKLSRKDIITGYIARVVSICSGLFTLPFVLRMLNENEIAFNYITITLMSLVVLFDMGFSSQFARNFAFIFGGAQTLSKEGTPTDTANFINYELLYKVIKAAQLFYACMSIVLLFLLLTLGTWYIYDFTNGFSIIDNVLYIWILFSLSIVFDFYYRYFTPLLMGKGMIYEVNNIEIFSLIFRIILLVILLFLDFGLWSIVISNFTRIILLRIASVKCFYDKKISNIFSKFKTRKYEIYEIIKILWFNAKKNMIVALTNYTSSQLGLFFTGLYLGKNDVAGYGLLLQLLNVISSLSMSIHQNSIPLYSTLRTRNNFEQIKDIFFFSMGVLYWIFIGGAIVIIGFGPLLLKAIGSNAVLPSTFICLILFLYRFLQNQHVICSTYMCSQNKIVDFESSTILGIINFIGLWSVLQFTNWGLMGIVLVQFITALSYPNWKWPYEVCKEFKISFPQFIQYSFYYTNKKLKKILMK